MPRTPEPAAGRRGAWWVIALVASGLAGGNAAGAEGTDGGAGVLVRPILARDRAASAAAAAMAVFPRDAGAGRAGPRRGFDGADPARAVSSSSGGRGHLSPARAFLYSAVLPGLGELAQGSKSGLAFMAVDAASWTGVVVYNRRGHRGEDDYRRYVDANYSRDQYAAVVAKVYREYEGGYCQTAGSDTSFICEDLAAYFGLDQDTHSGHYYEDVGKLDKYIFGWRDWADTTGDGASDYDPATAPAAFGQPWRPGAAWPEGFPPLTSALRAHYQDLRRAANRNFAHADKFAWVLVLNRVVSGFHAAWMAHEAGSRGEESTRDPETHLVIDPAAANGTVRVALARRF